MLTPLVSLLEARLLLLGLLNYSSGVLEASTHLSQEAAGVHLRTLLVASYRSPNQGQIFASYVFEISFA